MVVTKIVIPSWIFLKIKFCNANSSSVVMKMTIYYRLLHSSSSLSSSLLKHLEDRYRWPNISALIVYLRRWSWLLLIDAALNSTVCVTAFIFKCNFCRKYYYDSDCGNHLFIEGIDKPLLEQWRRDAVTNTIVFIYLHLSVVAISRIQFWINSSIFALKSFLHWWRWYCYEM